MHALHSASSTRSLACAWACCFGLRAKSTNSADTVHGDPDHCLHCGGPVRLPLPSVADPGAVNRSIEVAGARDWWLLIAQVWPGSRTAILHSNSHRDLRLGDLPKAGEWKALNLQSNSRDYAAESCWKGNGGQVKCCWGDFTDCP